MSGIGFRELNGNITLYRGGYFRATHRSCWSWLALLLLIRLDRRSSDNLSKAQVASVLNRKE